MTAPSPAHTYYLCFPRRWKREPLAWNPFAPCTDPLLHVRTAYLGGVFRAMEDHLDPTGLTFFLTPDLHALPAYGPDVVAVVQGDEPARIPTYAHRVRATFKAYGTRQARPPHLFRSFSYPNLLAHAQYVRDAVRRLPGRLHYARHRRRHPQGLPPVYPIPLGYANQLDLPLLPIEARETDVFFAGSVTHRDYPAWSLKRWLRSPKDLARTQMLAGLAAARDRLPGLQADLRLQPTFRQSIKASAEAYSAGMMNARICLVPRGASVETYRFFEAMRYGCITLTEVLPPHWFYEGTPALQVTHWQDLPDLLAALLEDREQLRARHEATLAWWQSRCSEAAVGRYVADKLNAS